MPIWQRLLITLAVMLLTSYLVGLLWHWLLNSDIPSYLGGAVGGLIPNPIDQNPWAHWRSPMDMMRQG